MAHFAAPTINATSTDSKAARANAAVAETASTISSSAGYYANAISQKTKLILPTAMWVLLGLSLICALSLLASLNHTLNSLDTIIENDQKLSLAAAQLMFGPENRDDSEKLLATMSEPLISNNKNSNKKDDNNNNKKSNKNTDNDDLSDLEKSFKLMKSSVEKLFDEPTSQVGKLNKSLDGATVIISSTPNFGAPLSEKKHASSPLFADTRPPLVDTEFGDFIGKFLNDNSNNVNVAEEAMVSEQTVCVNGECTKTVKTSGNPQMLPAQRRLPFMPRPLSPPPPAPRPAPFAANALTSERPQAPLISANIDKLNIYLSSKSDDDDADDETNDAAELDLFPGAKFSSILDMLRGPPPPPPSPLLDGQAAPFNKHPSLIDVIDRIIKNNEFDSDNVKLDDRQRPPASIISIEPIPQPRPPMHRQPPPPPPTRQQSQRPPIELLNKLFDDGPNSDDTPVVMFVPLGINDDDQLQSPIMPPHLLRQPPPPPPPSRADGKPFDAPYELSEEKPLPPLMFVNQPPAVEPLSSGPNSHPHPQSPPPPPPPQPQPSPLLIQEPPIFSLFNSFGPNPFAHIFDVKETRQTKPKPTKTIASKAPATTTTQWPLEAESDSVVILTTSKPKASSTKQEVKKKPVGYSDSFPEFDKQTSFDSFFFDDDDAFFKKHFGKSNEIKKAGKNINEKEAATTTPSSIIKEGVKQQEGTAKTPASSDITKKPLPLWKQALAYFKLDSNDTTASTIEPKLNIDSRGVLPEESYKKDATTTAKPEDITTFSPETTPPTKAHISPFELDKLLEKNSNVVSRPNQDMIESEVIKVASDSHSKLSKTTSKPTTSIVEYEEATTTKSSA